MHAGRRHILSWGAFSHTQQMPTAQDVHSERTAENQRERALEGKHNQTTCSLHIKHFLVTVTDTLQRIIYSTV